MEGMLGVAEYLDETNINVASTSAFRLYAILDQKMSKPKNQECKNTKTCSDSEAQRQAK